MKEFIIRDYYDLLNLHKALMEAKFHKNPENEYIAGSPVIAKIMNEIVDLLSEMDPYANESEWRNWRNIGQRRAEEELTEMEGVWERMIVSAVNDCMWSKYTFEKKKSLAQIYLSPFIASEHELEVFVYEVDRRTANNNVHQTKCSNVDFPF